MNAKKSRILHRQFMRKDNGLIATCEANKDELAKAGYTGSCEEFFKQVAADNEEILAAMSSKKSR